MSGLSTDDRRNASATLLRAVATFFPLLVAQTLYFSQFFPYFFVGLRRICLCATYLILNIGICSLLVRIDCVVMKAEWNAIFSWLKNTLFNSQFSSQNTGDHILGLWNSTIFWGSMPPDPPRRRELTARCWYSRLLYSNLLATSIIIIETPGFTVMADFRVCRLSCWPATGNFGCR